MFAEIDPALDKSIDQPERGRQQNGPADQEKSRDGADDHPYKRVPERLRLPTKVTFDPTPLHILPANVVDNGPGKEGQGAGKKAGRL